MSYRGAPFTGVSGLFPRDDEVLAYLEDYSKDILPAIRLNTLIKRIYKLDQTWIVESATVSRPSKIEIERYDAICDCSGHYTQPFLPYIKDLWRFKGRKLHSKWYRTPDSFEGHDVLIIGNNFSGFDLARLIATHFMSRKSQNTVYLSARHPYKTGADPIEGASWAAQIQQVSAIECTTENEVLLSDGKRITVDTIIFATGDAVYPDGGLQVHSLDAEYQTFFSPDPTLAFVCLNRLVVPFPLAQVQAHAIGRYWAGQNWPLQHSTTLGEDPRLHTYGFPKDFDVADALLRAAGEGQIREGEEILADGSFPATARWRREMRPLCSILRKQELGY
ncbi:MAG: hypothetical protein CYPHOPRED_005339 [Cyphobasidiales sp. Tagirdzhanova-0007]|nr:MAG: hypothetical protein CYPHOPRED_005339 [Cyphobasidiales sp. Tagirdzhanova-0007]